MTFFAWNCKFTVIAQKYLYAKILFVAVEAVELRIVF